MEKSAKILILRLFLVWFILLLAELKQAKFLSTPLILKLQRLYKYKNGTFNLNIIDSFDSEQYENK